jgi:hypothetical protein
MGVEFKDPVSGKYILYCSETAHRRECALYPYVQIPQRIFLDTSVVNALVKCASYIFEGQPIDPKMEPVLAEDVESLSHIFAVSAPAPWEIVASPSVLDEIRQTRLDEIRDALLDYGVNLAESPEPGDAWFREDFSRRLSASSLLLALPDEGDRRLLAQSIAMGCDVFCTRDRATIVSKRDLLPRMPVRVLTPREWWAHLKPWLGLFL